MSPPRHDFTRLVTLTATLNADSMGLVVTKVFASMGGNFSFATVQHEQHQVFEVQTPLPQVR